MGADEVKLQAFLAEGMSHDLVVEEAVKTCIRTTGAQGWSTDNYLQYCCLVAVLAHYVELDKSAVLCDPVYKYRSTLPCKHC